MRNQLYHICHLMLVAGLAFCLVGCQDKEWMTIMGWERIFHLKT